MIPDSDSKRLHAIVEGTVQGVGFRGYVLERGTFLGLTGWVRNCWDGNVEVLAEGPANVLEQFIEDLRRGPQLAHVSNVRIEWGISKNEFSSFFVARSS